MNGAIWSLEWRVALRRRRLLLLNAAIPLLLVLPVAFAGAPASHAGTVYTVLFVLFGTFGSAIPLIRDGEGGFLARVRDTGFPDAWHLMQRTAAAAALDVVELLPALALAAVGELGAAAAGPAVAGALPVLALSLLVANLLGPWVAAAARSLAEAALFAAVLSLLLLHASGVFRTPAPGSTGAAVERLAPFRALHDALLAVASGAPAGGKVTGLATPGWVAALVAATALLAPWLLERVGSSRDG